MGILSNLLQKYSAEEDASKTDQTTPPTQQAISQSQSQPQNGLLSIDAELQEKMRTNPRARAVRQLSLFAAGATFFGLSMLVTRRAIARKVLATTPRQFTPSNFQPKDANGAVEAAEAFGLATLNVTSAAMMLTGGAMFAFDITDSEDLRQKVRHRMGFDRIPPNEEEADKEMEELVKQFLDKKDGGDNKSIAEGLTALVGALAGKEEERLERLQKPKDEANEDK